MKLGYGFRWLGPRPMRLFRVPFMTFNHHEPSGGWWLRVGPLAFRYRWPW